MARFKKKRRVSEFRTELLVQKRILKEVLEIKKEVRKMAKTQSELQSAITGLVDAVEIQVTNQKEMVRLQKVLLDKIKAGPNAADFTAEVDQLETATAKLTGDDADVQTAIDEATAAQG